MTRSAFACFHLTPPNKGTAETYWAFFQIMAATIRRVCPDAEIHLLTNSHADVPEGLNVDQVFRLETARSQKECFERLMVEEVECWQAYFASNLFAGPTVLIDVDLLIQKNPFVLFDGEFDIGLTYTDDPSLHAFNSGVILVDPTRPENIQRYFASVVERVQGYAPEFQEWYGDQMAIAAMLGDPNFSAASPAIIDQEKAGVLYRLWPTVAWNYSLPLDADNKPIFKAAPDPGILHFKGERKGLMLRYAVEVLGFKAFENSEAVGGWEISDPV
jgi:hypothetical protein